MPQTWDQEFDVVVVGSGGAGLTAGTVFGRIAGAGAAGGDVA